LARLEATTGVNKVFPTIFLSMTIDDRVYHRAEGEPEATFRARAMAEANEAVGRPRGVQIRLVFLRS
jgi:hypothetical protein